MNQDRTSQPKQTFNLLNITTITTIIITPGADIGLWWSCRAIGIITTTIITITAITEIAYPRWKMKTGPSGSCFFHAGCSRPEAFSSREAARTRLKTLLLACLLFCRAMEMPIGPVKYRVRG